MKKVLDLVAGQSGSEEGKFVDPSVPEARSSISFLAAGLVRDSSDAERVVRLCLESV